MIYIGIDPDIDKCGYAVWDSDTKELEVYNLTFAQIIDDFNSWNVDFEVHIEAGWLNKKSNFHKMQGSFIREKVAKNVGENQAVGKLLAQYCEHNYIPYKLIKPKGKINDEMFKKITGYKGRSNQEQRDAAMLVFNL